MLISNSLIIFYFSSISFYTYSFYSSYAFFYFYSDCIYASTDLVSLSNFSKSERKCSTAFFKFSLPLPRREGSSRSFRKTCCSYSSFSFRSSFFRSISERDFSRSAFWRSSLVIWRSVSLISLWISLMSPFILSISGSNLSFSLYSFILMSTSRSWCSFSN